MNNNLYFIHPFQNHANVKKRNIYLSSWIFFSFTRSKSTNAHPLLISDFIYISNSNTGYESDVTLNYGDDIFIQIILFTQFLIKNNQLNEIEKQR